MMAAKTTQSSSNLPLQKIKNFSYMTPPSFLTEDKKKILKTDQKMKKRRH